MKGVNDAVRPEEVSGIVTLAASTHVSDTFHLTPGTNVTMFSADASGVSRIVCTPASVG